MADRNDVERLVAAAYETRDAGDVSAILACFIPAVTFRIAGSSALAPLTPPQQGHEAFAGRLRHLIDNWNRSGLAMRIACIEGETAAVHRQGTIRDIATGRSVQTEIVGLLRIVAFAEFLGTCAPGRTAILR